jgi:phosphoserine aminotransferase
MNPNYFTAGPSQIHAQFANIYLQGLQLGYGSISHRSATFREIYKHTDLQLRQLLELPTSHKIFFTGSGSEIWERSISNLVEDHSFHLVNGSFSKKFFNYAKGLGKKAAAITMPHGKGFEIEEVMFPENTELICTTQNETSSGVSMPVQDLISIKNRNPNALLITDIVSIAPLSSIPYSHVDSSFFSVQKAFGMPAGLGVWIVNDRCIEKSKQLVTKNISVGPHQSLNDFDTNYDKWETPNTPNVMAIYCLGKIAEEMNQTGMANIQKEIDSKADLLYSFADNNKKYTPVVANKAHRSKSVIVLQCNNSGLLIQKLAEKNLFISNGYAEFKNQEIRIANFPTTSIAQLQILIEELAAN